MRVIAGSLGGRTINSPKMRRTHPMSDKMRGGLFNTLGDIVGLDVLDVFSGSGALAIEAISRGAKSALAIESDPTAIQAIKDNIEILNLDNKMKATKAYFSSWSNINPDRFFDVVLADPPYNELRMKQLSKLPKHLKPSGTLVLSWPGKEEVLDLKTLKIVRTKNYGDGQLVFYRKIS